MFEREFMQSTIQAKWINTHNKCRCYNTWLHLCHLSCSISSVFWV